MGQAGHGLAPEAVEGEAPAVSREALRAAIGDATAPVVEDIATRVQAEISEFAGPAEGRRHQLIARATSAGIQQFLDTLSSGTRGTAQGDRLFRQMGYGEAMDGHDLEPINSAMRLAFRIAWDELRTLVVAHDVSAATLSRLSELLTAEMDHLFSEVAAGHADGRHRLANDRDRARQHLLHLLLDGAPAAELGERAAIAQWSLPSRLVVVFVEHEPGTLPAVDDLELLAGFGPGGGVFVGTHESTEELLARLPNAPTVRAAVSWPVEAPGAAAALRWTRRALDLVRRRVLPTAQVTRCVDHDTQLWLHSEPILRQRLVQQMLPPLLAETPNSREILSETLLVWLETRDSAPAIADRLGVHPQTVRYRWKRINDLFGEDLHDPEFVVKVTMLLKASVPLWKAGDQSDFELFHSQET